MGEGDNHFPKVTVTFWVDSLPVRGMLREDRNIMKQGSGQIDFDFISRYNKTTNQRLDKEGEHVG
jgi:hypothetical protein